MQWHKFQFPTGWNSTFTRVWIFYWCGAFQFPTRWNSTPQGTKVVGSYSRFQFPTGWNSTPPKTAIMQIFSLVSIPNGMKFYPFSSVSPVHLVDSFNSQRMEFYEDKSSGTGLIQKKFQFPTGWTLHFSSGLRMQHVHVTIPNWIESWRVLSRTVMESNAFLLLGNNP